MKLLAVDRGNSRTKVAFQNEHRELEIAVFNNWNDEPLIEFIAGKKFDASVMSSVEAGPIINISEVLSARGYFLLADNTVPIPVKNTYTTPHTLGTDRIAGAVGAWVLEGEKDVLLMDAGTCINYECIINNEYLGGAIAPGLMMRLRAMHEFTGKLPLLELPPDQISLIGNSTASCMLSGAVMGMVYEMQGLEQAYKAQYPSISVVLSGGDAPYLGKYLKNSIFAPHKEVVLVGLLEILKFNLNV